MLRADIPSAPEIAPQPGLARLDELTEQYDGPVDLDVIGEQVPIPQAVDVSAYRIVQEALTNVRVHAPGARCRWQPPTPSASPTWAGDR